MKILNSQVYFFGVCFWAVEYRDGRRFLQSAPIVFHYFTLDFDFISLAGPKRGSTSIL